MLSCIQLRDDPNIVHYASPVKVKLCHPKAKVPTRADNGAAGYDIYASHQMVISPHCRGAVSTGVTMAIPAGTYGRIAPRSGLALNNGVDVGGGVIDSSYRGEIKVILFNHGDIDLIIVPGMRVAQLIFEVCVNATLATIPEEEELPKSDRGQGGFGSSGK